MPNLLSNFNECFGFSQIMKFTCSKIFLALRVISSRFPIGVDIMYKPFLIISIIFFIIIISCSPQNYVKKQNFPQNNTNDTKIILNESATQSKKTNIEIKSDVYADIKILNEVEIILPSTENKNISEDFINAFELALYEKEIKNISLNINTYSDKKELNEIISNKIKPGKIIIGPLTSSDLQNLNDECDKGIIFFTFASDRTQAGECIYLINFFPEDDLNTLFKSFDSNSRVVLLYPENNYGYYINSIIDPIAVKSNAIIINRASYKEDLTNAREAIKELSKYELRKYELERQKTILRTKDDQVSKKALKKIEKFDTTGLVDFTHIILPDYNIRLLQIAPLLPFYDIDPKKVQFVGTGVWDDKVFFNEPSLQGAIFPGVLQKKRINFIDSYYKNYNKTPTRTITIPYDLMGIIDYVVSQKLSLKDFYRLLNDPNTTFEGIDGKFSFKNNIISRELDILKISRGSANLIR